MADVKVTIIGEDKASAALAGVDKSLGGFANSFTELKSKLDLAQQAVSVFTGTFKQAFELGAEGAAIAQTGESFDMLTQKVGASSNLLEQLRAASRGTVDDMTLMTSTTTLLAGAEGELAGSLADATPRLMEIAKAANKLNPSLGDTNFMYQSLATGIKRASPLILDNLGLTIKVGEANETMAKSLGKTVEELTATEQKQALLNATLDAGAVLIDQAGGNVDSATDAFTRLEASTNNIVAAFKEKLAPVLADAAGALNILMTGDKQMADALQAHRSEMTKSTASYADYVKELTRAAEAAGYMVDEEGNLVKVRKDGGRVYKEIIQSQYIYSEATLEAARAEQKQLGIAGELPKALQSVGDKANTVAEAYTKMVESIGRASLDAGISGNMGEAFSGYVAKAQELEAENTSLIAQIQQLATQGFGPTSEEVQKLTDRMADNVTKQNELRDATIEATRQFIYQKAAANMSDEAALALGRSLGIVSEKDYQLTKTIMDGKVAADANKDGIIDLDEATAGYIQQLTSLSGTLSDTLGPAMDRANISVGNLALQAEYARRKAYDLQTTQEALAAGLSGDLTQAAQNYTERTAAMRLENAELMRQLTELDENGLGPTADEIESLSQKIRDNAAEQTKLRDSTNKTTKEFIFQKASANMDAGAALELGRAMGLVSETEYNVTTRIRDMNYALDANKSGMVDSNEITETYKQQIAALVKQYGIADGAVTRYGVALGNMSQQIAAAKEQAYQMQAAQSALSAGLSGAMHSALTNYVDVLRETTATDAELQGQYRQMVSGEIPSTATEIGKLTDKIRDNNQAQIDARAALRKTTDEMIYQRASQGLSEDAALYLARSMGMISDEDYKAMVSLEQLRAQFDLNRDGAITAAEGADKYAQAVLNLRGQIMALQDVTAARQAAQLSPADPGIFSFSAGQTWTAPMVSSLQGQPGGVTVNYSPTLSTASQYELEQALGPIIQKYTR